MVHYKNYNKTLSVAIAAWMLFLPQGAQAKTLAESIQTAWKKHPSIDAAAAGSGFAAREIKEEFSAYLPDLNLSASGGRLFANNSTSRGINTVRGEGYSGTWDGNVALRQQFFDGGQRDGRVNSAKLRLKAAQSTISDTKDILASSVAASYIELLRVYRAMSMFEQHRAAMQSYVDRLKQAVAEGAADDSEYNQALELQLSLQNIAIDVETQLKNAEAAYIESVGEPPMGALSTPILPDGTIPPSAEAAIAYAKAAHPALMRARQESQSAAYDIEAERAGFYPTIDGELSYLKSERRDVIGGEAEEMKALMRMNWNFETGGGTFHRIGKRKFLHEESLARVRELERQINRAIRFGYAEYEGATQQLVMENERLTLFENLFATYREQFEGARISLLQLMQAENQKFLAHLDQVSAQHRVLNAQYAILSAMGQAQTVAGGYEDAAMAKADFDGR